MEGWNETLYGDHLTQSLAHSRPSVTWVLITLPLFGNLVSVISNTLFSDTALRSHLWESFKGTESKGKTYLGKVVILIWWHEDIWGLNVSFWRSKVPRAWLRMKKTFYDSENSNVHSKIDQDFLRSLTSKFKTMKSISFCNLFKSPKGQF